MPRIGALSFGNPEPAWQLVRDGLQALGYVEGKTVRLELRSAEGQIDRLPGLAAELVHLPVDLIVAFPTPAVQAAKQATRDIPIVMATAGDPVGTGLIADIARPEGNITGVMSATAELGAKGLELIREILPKAGRVAVLANAIDPFTTRFLDHIGRGARALGIAVQPLMVHGAADYDAAFASMLNERADAFVHQPSLPRKRAIELALQHRLPSFAPQRAFAEEGGLLSYAASFAAQYRNVASYIDKILKGRKPADLPVEQPTTFELVVNLKTANALGLTVPPSVLGRADDVIE
jgi:putative ABC transport system substrate-binding protein